ncbi:P-loop containing nucleoside triphosphate hydrolase protein, partial [Pisolithus albus]
ANWISSQQRDAVLAVARWTTDVIALLKTGGGKSMLAIIPALLNPLEGIVVTLPLKSLMDDWKRRLTDLGIPYQEYTHGPLKTDTNVILVSADRSMLPGWTQALAEVNEVMKVTRLVFDEAHLTLASQNFRPSMRRAAELRILPMQIILLSGTVPPSS